MDPSHIQQLDSISNINIIQSSTHRSSENVMWEWVSVHKRTRSLDAEKRSMATKLFRWLRITKVKIHWMRKQRRERERERERAKESEREMNIYIYTWTHVYKKEMEYSEWVRANGVCVSISLCVYMFHRRHMVIWNPWVATQHIHERILAHAHFVVHSLCVNIDEYFAPVAIVIAVTHLPFEMY